MPRIPLVVRRGNARIPLNQYHMLVEALDAHTNDAIMSYLRPSDDDICPKCKVITGKTPDLVRLNLQQLSYLWRSRKQRSLRFRIWRQIGRDGAIHQFDPVVRSKKRRKTEGAQ
jgi:siroheme synthase (precorrin-2 oxidase/ferrochelatase)